MKATMKTVCLAMAVLLLTVAAAMASPLVENAAASFALMLSDCHIENEK